MRKFIYIIFLLAFSQILNAQKQDTLKTRILKQWHLSKDYSEEVNVPFDTVFSLFNRYRRADTYSPFNVTLGNYGLPFYQINFFDRVTDPDKFLKSYYYPLMHVSDNAVFMNTQVPFTELDWTFAGPTTTSEQTFRIRHSQNVNRYLNFGLIYDIIYNLGQYSYQRAEDKDFTFFSSYTGERYKLYFSAGINNLTAHENGGIISKNDLYISSKRDIQVNLGNLNSAVSQLKNKNLLLVQRYTIIDRSVNSSDTVKKIRSGFLGLTGTFSHILTIESDKRTYSDSKPLSGFYSDALISSSSTFDSINARSIKNTLRFDFETDPSRKFRLGGGVGLRNENFVYSQIVPSHDLNLADSVMWKKGNNVLVGRLYNNIGDKFKWSTTAEMFATGYRSGDFNLDGEIIKSFDFKKGRVSWFITGRVANTRPSFWYEQWGGNNFEWHNNFDKEFRMDLSSGLSYPARNTEIQFNYAVIKNYTGFGTDSLPFQFSSALSVAALKITKGMQAWKFHLVTDLLFQKSSNSDVLDLPFVTIRSAGYFEHLFVFKQTGGKLNTQLGVDVTYNTLYHPYSYNPATGRFFNQSLSTGNYPFINVFLNLKIKRTRIFVMFDHVNYDMMGNNYEMVPLYPLNIRTLRYGLAWTFYN
jgi:hypothetical protein